MINRQWFRRELSFWYRQHKRDLPWRQQSDPYKIWVSEVILQQTRVEQGMSYYFNFLSQFPNVSLLAAASEDEVLKVWQGLGYYSRARNMHAAAKQIADELKGKFPTDYNGLIKLKGVGSYTAAAIASFAFNKPHVVVDGNVLRFIGRLYGVFTPIDTQKGKQEIFNISDELLDRENPAQFNQAIMEFGSQFCRPSNPDCESCPFSSKCIAYKTNAVKEIPVKSKKTKQKRRYFNYVVMIDSKGRANIRKREGKDIWKGLYEFELIESEKPLKEEKFMITARAHFKILRNAKLIHQSKAYEHILSHQIIHARFYVFRLKAAMPPGALRISLQSLTKTPFPRLTEKFLEDCQLTDL